MAKNLRLTDEQKKKLLKEFTKALDEPFDEGEFKFESKPEPVKAKAKLIFSMEAFSKIWYLVGTCDKEVGWHGTAHRGDEKYEYVVDDIFVYPQVVTGATVTTDQEKYQNWLMSLDDETFNNLRYQGHSHVNMGVSPSSVDKSLYSRLLDQLEDDMFYIFEIINKKGDETFIIYDYKENIIFETDDIDVYIMDGGFIDTIHENVNDEPVKTATTTTTQTTTKGTDYYNKQWWDDKNKEYGDYRKYYGSAAYWDDLY